MNTRVARVEFVDMDTDQTVVIERFRYAEMDEVFDIIHNAYKAIIRAFPNVRMIEFITID